MNNNDIIKALDCCGTWQNCSGCPMLGKRDCISKLFVESMHIINRLKTEIEKLRQENDELKDGYFQKRYEETEHQELMGLREAWRKSTDQNMDLQLEIERLEAEMDKQYEQAEADILGNISDGGTSCHWCIEQHRTKAIKEFAERLKENISNMEYTADVKRKTVPTETLFAQVNWVFHEIVPETIDKLAKEMTEVQHGEAD